MKVLKLAVLATFAMATAVVGCGDMEGELDVSGVETVEQELHAARAVVRLEGPITSDINPPSFACSALEHTTFLATPNGCGITMTVSDCHWNASTQRCDCTVTIETC